MFLESKFVDIFLEIELIKIICQIDNDDDWIEL